MEQLYEYKSYGRKAQMRKQHCKGLLLLLFSCSVVSDSATPWTPGFLVLHHLPEFAQLMSIESVMPSHMPDPRQRSRATRACSSA